MTIHFSRLYDYCLFIEPSLFLPVRIVVLRLTIHTYFTILPFINKMLVVSILTKSFLSSYLHNLGLPFKYTLRSINVLEFYTEISTNNRRSPFINDMSLL